MGLLDLILGQQNPVAQWADNNQGTLGAIGAGLGSGPTFAQGMANAAQMIPQGKQADRQYQYMMQQRNATANWLQQIGHPELIGPAMSGAMSFNDVLGQVYKAPTVVSPGDSVLPNQFMNQAGYGVPSAGGTAQVPLPQGQMSGMPPQAPASAAMGGGAAPQQQAGSGAPNMGGMQPVFTAPTSDPSKMTATQRAAAADAQGITGEARGTFILTGRMPYAATINWRPITPAERATNGIAPDDPAVYQINNQNQIRTVPGAMSTTISNGTGPVVGLGQDGLPDPQQQQAYLSGLPPAQAAAVKGVINYQLDPTKVASMRGNGRQQLIQQAISADPTFDMTQYPARAAMKKSVASGTFAQNITAANTAIQHLAELDATVDKLGNTNFPMANAAKNALAEQTGSQDITTFRQTATAAADELAKLFKGTGVSDVETIRAWGAGLDVNNSPAQLHGAIRNAVSNLLKARLDTLESQYTQTMGRPPDFTFIKLDSATALKQLGVDPSQLDPTAGNQAAQASSGGMPNIQDLLDKYK